MFKLCPIAPIGGWGSQKPPLGVMIDRGHPLASGLVAFWCINGAGGILEDAAEILPSAAITGATRQSSDKGQVLRFTGNNAECAEIPMRGADPFGGKYLSVFAWLRFSGSSSNNSYPRIVDRVSGGQFAAYINDIDYPTYKLGMAFRGAGGYFDQSALASAGSVGTMWHSYGWTYDGVTARAFFDGGLAGSSSAPYGALYVIGSDIRIGQRVDSPGNNRGYKGDIACLGVWTRPLLASEFGQLHAQPYCMFAAGMPFAAQQASRPLIDGSLASDSPLLGTLA